MERAVRCHRETLLACLLIFLLSFAAYYPVLNNFFTWDDFLWLYRAKTLHSNPLQIFSIDAVYFDPLVYLWFWTDFNLYGLHPFAYHLGDVALHSVNGVLVYLLMCNWVKERIASLASALIFVSSFAVVDAVAWSSSRVDILAVFFSLLSILFFLRHLTDKSRRSFAVSVAAFIFALGSKGTPLLLPCMIAVILSVRGELRERWRLLIPFISIVLIYVPTLVWRLTAENRLLLAGKVGGLNIFNLLLSFSELFVPEIRLNQIDTVWTAVAIAVIITLCACFLPVDYRKVAVFSLVLIAIGLTPVLILKNFQIPTAMTDAGLLLSSPSHRIYLASAGAACLIGTIIAPFVHRPGYKYPVYILLLLTISYSIYEVRLRQELWRGSARYIQGSVEGLAVYRKQLIDDSAVGLVNFPMSRGFMRPALALYCGLERVLLLPMDSIPDEILDSPEIFRYRNRGFFFAYKETRVVNLSGAFVRLLDVAFYYQISRDQQERARLRTEYSSLAREINSAIARPPESLSPATNSREI